MSTDSDKLSTINENFLEQVIKYIKIDDIIKEKQKKEREIINNLKDRKKQLETVIIKYLNENESGCVNIGSKGKIVKNVTTTKGTIKQEYIQDSIVDGLIETNTCKDKELCSKVMETIMLLIDKKRPINKREYLRRVVKKNKKE